MELKHFKLMKEDADSYHVAHPSGRAMIVSKKGLSPKAHDAIKTMPVQKFEGGGGVQPEEFVPGQSYADAPLPGDINSTLAPERPAVTMASVLPQFADRSLTQQPDGTVTDASPAPAVPPPQETAPGNAGPVSQPAQADPLSNNFSSENAVLTKQQNEIANAFKTESGAENAKAGAFGDLISKLPKLDEPLKSPQEIAQGYKQKNDELLKAITDEKIDPDRYLHSMSTGSKITSAIAMILSGLGNGIGGHPNAPNMALEVLQKNINNDIDAQKNDQSKKMSLWKMNREAMNSDLEANLATQNQMLTGVQAKVSRATAQSASAMAKLHGQQLISQLEQQKNHNNLILGLSQQTSPGGFSQADPAQLVTSLVPETHQKQVFTEIGQAQNAAKNEAPMMEAFNKLNQENTAAGRAKRLGFEPPSSKVFDALADPLIHDNEGRINELEQRHVQALKPQPFDREETVMQKEAGLKAFIESKKAAPTAKGFGLDLNKFASTSSDARARYTPQQSQFYNWAIQNIKNPDPGLKNKALLALQKLGVK